MTSLQGNVQQANDIREWKLKPISYQNSSNKKRQDKNKPKQ